MKMKTEIEISEHLSVKTIDDKCILHVNGKPFKQCSYLLITVPANGLAEGDSIDEFAEKYSNKLENNKNKSLITKETELWAHASNLQAWVENDYDTRLLHSNLAFPLLKELSKHDERAKQRFKEEVILRINCGYEPVIKYLFNEGYVSVFKPDEFREILKKTDYFRDNTSKMKIFLGYLQNFTKYVEFCCFLVQGFYIRALKHDRSSPNMRRAFKLVMKAIKISLEKRVGLTAWSRKDA